MTNQTLDKEHISKQIKSLLADLGNHRHRHPCPDSLFHYTSPHGLLGIMQSNRIWATNVRYMNDSTELSYTYSLAHEIISGMRSKENSQIVQYFFDCFGNYIKEDNLYNDFFDVFAFCFCEKGDQLSQWREYSERGTGFSIGFDAPMITNEHIKRYSNYGLVKVIYDRPTQRTYLEYVIVSCMSELISLAKLAMTDQIPELVFEFCRALDAGISTYAAQYKDEAFHEENEWRIVYIRPSIDIISEIKFKHSNRIIIPYVELDLTASEVSFGCRLPITSIFQGPQSHPEIGKYSLSLLLKQLKFDDVVIYKSSVPLRF